MSCNTYANYVVEDGSLRYVYSLTIHRDLHNDASMTPRAIRPKTSRKRGYKLPTVRASLCCVSVASFYTFSSADLYGDCTAPN
jgi:hypothetical protein